MEITMTTPTPVSAKYLRTKPAANYVGLSKSTLDKFRVIGGGPKYSTLGRAVVYAIADLDKWVLFNRRNSTSE